MGSAGVFRPGFPVLGQGLGRVTLRHAMTQGVW